MIDNFTNILDAFILSITFTCHFLIFGGIFYTVLENKTLKIWQRTSLWYIGISNLFVLFTILFQWAFGSAFPMSYDRIGIMGEVLMLMSMAAGAITMLLAVKKHNEVQHAEKIAAEKMAETKRDFKLVKRPNTTNSLKPLRKKLK
jgi:hypothetical protein